MSSTAPPTTPARKNTVTATRSFTAPTARRAAAPKAHASIGETGGVETLFVHPNTKVVRFTSPSRRGSSAGPPSPDAKGLANLPWATPTEKTMAAGPLEIYRVPGSVSFLHSGALLHTIMPRSNCWCVDGVSKFAMRVLPDTYYRIELPGDTPEDLEQVREFKLTLANVLFYERTACPFARTFSVDLPEEDVVKVQKRRTRTDGPAKKWKLNKAYSWRPEGWTPDQHRLSDESSGSQTATDDEGSPCSADDHVEKTARQAAEMKITTPSRRTVRDRAQGFNLRSITAPFQISLQSTPPSLLRTPFLADDNAAVLERCRETSRCPSRGAHIEAGTLQQSQRTLQAIPTDMPPSPPDSSAGFELTSPRANLRTPLPQQAGSQQDRGEAVLPSAHNPPKLAIAKGAAAIARSAADFGQPDVNPSDPDGDDKAEHTSVAAGPHEIVRGPPVSLRQVERPVNGELVSVAKGSTPVRSQHELGAPYSHVPFGFRTNNQSAPLPGTQLDGADPDRVDRVLPLRDAKASDLDNEDTSAIFTETPPASKVELESSAPDQGESSKRDDASPDPYAQIQARIQARRTIGVTTGFGPLKKQTKLQPSSSTSSLNSRRSRRGRHNDPRQDQAMAAGLVRKAYDTFLGPPAHLIAIMLKIAARFAQGTFRNTLLYESPPSMKKRIPGSFDLDDSDIEDQVGSHEDDELDGSGEDDFGVPLRSPIRMRSAEAGPRQIANPSIKERKGWQVES